MKTTTWDGAWLDSMYNNRALVPSYADYFRRWSAASGEALRTQRCRLDIRYGGGPNEHLDIFEAEQADAPVLFFIHGGYWRALDKKDHAFVAPAFTRQGACVVIPNYALAPAVTVPQITMQMVAALAWTWRNIARHGGDPSRITVVGHSAGGHLAAMMLACLWPVYGKELPPDLVKNALSISGLHDLEPIMHTPFLQVDLKLTPQQVRQASPALLPAPATGVLAAVAGGDESAEFHRQVESIRKAWGPASVPVADVLPGLNHFSVLDALLQPDQRLHRMAKEFLGV
ncbi:alpha/beta hydrolase [Caenimonas terrae]|uniref:Alpha/beta hydrolase n=1 Tax=Caenimonas terrae TaxID=696074 RepID=A0ABW0NEQ6_9BURK